MSLRPALEAELRRLIGYSSAQPVTIDLVGPAGIRLSIELTIVDSLSCAFRQLTVDVPALQNAAFDALKKWAEALSRRITYLLESLSPLEFDPTGGQVLIRSTTPDQLPDGTQYFEMVLSSQGTGSFVLRRYRAVKGIPGRDPIDMQVTHEVLGKLCDDLVDTVTPP